MPAKSKVVEDGKTIAIVAYITWIGLIVALIMNGEKKNEFAKYHIRQSLLIMIAALVLGWIPFVGWVCSIILLIFAIMGLVYAAQGEQKEVPILGKLAQDWFKGI